MDPAAKTKAQLRREVEALRGRVALLEAEVRRGRLAEAAIAESEQRFRSVVEHSHDGLIIINDRFEIVYANNRICQMTGHGREELVGSSPLIFTAPEAHALTTQRHLRRIAGEDVPSRYQFDLMRRDGRRLHVEISATVFTDKAGQRFNVAQFLDITEQCTARAALRESEERYRLLTDHSLTGIYVIQDGKFVYVNARFAEILGAPAEELIGSDFWGHVHPLDREMVKSRGLARQRGASDIPSRYEYRIVRNDGGLAWVEILATTITLNGALANMGNVLDISKRKGTETALVESESRFRCLQEASFGGIAIHDDGIIQDANQALSELTGHSHEELIGMDGLLLIAPRWRDAVRAKIRSAYGLAYEVEGLRKDGTIYPLEIRGKTMPYKGGVARVTEFRDATERIQAEKALLKSEERFAAALKASPQWMDISTRAEGRFMEVNEAFTTISGYGREEAIGRTCRELGFWPDPGERERVMGRLDSRGCLRNHEVLWRLADGRLHHLLWSADPIDWAGRECLINALTDVTELKRAQEDLRASEERYRSVMEAAYEPMVVYDLEGRVRYINPAFTRVFGWGAEELLGRRVDFVPPEEGDRTMRQVESALREGYCENFETRRLTKDGRLLDISISAAHYRDHDGNVTGIVAHLRDIGQRKKDERALLLSEARLKHMLELAGDWFWEMGQDLRFTMLSPKFFAMTGLGRGDIIGKRRWDYTDSGRILCDRRRWEEHVRTVQAHLPFHNFEYGFLTESGRPFHMSISGVPLFDEDGRFCGYRGSGTEITERVLAQEDLQKAHDELEEKVRERTAELAESRRNFMQAFHESPAWMCITDMATGRFIEANNAYSHGLGRTREELIGRTTLEAGIWAGDEVRRNWVRTVRAAAEIGAPSLVEAELMHKDGTVRSVTGTVGIMHWGGKEVFVSNAVDLTEQKKAQAALRESELQYRTILDNTGTATSIVDENADIAYANPQFCRLVGYPAEELVGRIKWTELVHPDDAQRMLQYARKRREPGGEAPRNYEFRVIERSGAIRHVYLTAAMIPGTTRNVSSLMDITELKQAQEELRRHRDRLEEMVGERTSELRAALGEKEVLLREIHHRVKNNMAVVSSLLNLQANKVNDLGVRMALQESRNRVRAMSLIHETLYRSENLAEVDLQKYIDGLVANLVGIFHGQAGNIEFRVDAGGVKLEAGRAVPCGLIVNELVTNSLKYAFPRGGAGRVSIAARLLDGGMVELAARDSGVGFPPELDLAESKSLGLRLIGLMVEQLHGQWEVDNQGGAGVTIRWPLGND